MAERPEACPEWQEDLAGWVTAQLAPDREARFASHLDTCAVCRLEVESLLTVAAVTLATDPDGPVGGEDRPPVDLRQRIVASVAAERRHRAVRRAAALGGVASVAAAVLVAVLVRDDRDAAPLRGEEVAFTVVPEGAWAEAVVAADDHGSVVQLTAGGLDPDVTYALWLTPPGGSWQDRVAAGTFRPDEDGGVDVRLPSALPADDYGRAWATTPDGEIALDTK